MQETVSRLAVFCYPKPLTNAHLEGYWQAVHRELAKPPGQRSFSSPPGGWMLENLVVDARQLTSDWQLQTAELRLERIELARQEFRLRHHREATSLTELGIAGHDILQDPYDGRPLRYRKVGARYLLYSIGPDGKDDGGKVVPLGDILAGKSGDLVADEVILGHNSHSH